MRIARSALSAAKRQILSPGPVRSRSYPDTKPQRSFCPEHPKVLRPLTLHPPNSRRQATRLTPRRSTLAVIGLQARNDSTIGGGQRIMV